MEITWLHRWTTAWFSLIARLTLTPCWRLEFNKNVFSMSTWIKAKLVPFLYFAPIPYSMCLASTSNYGVVSHIPLNVPTAVCTPPTPDIERIEFFSTIGIPFCSIICGLIFHWLPYGTDICVAFFFILTLFVLFFLLLRFYYWSLCIYIVSSAKHK